MDSLLLAIILTTAGPEVEVQTLDGETVAGSIVALDADRITVQTADGPVSLDTGKLLGLFLKNEPRPPEQEPGAWIELVDGSSLLAGHYTTTGGQAQITLTDGQIVELPAAGVATVRLQSHTEAVASEWSRILNMEIDSDLLVVRKGETVDYHKGVLRDVTDTVVQFELDGDVLPVKRSKVHGLVYYHPPGGTLPETVCRITDAGGSRWSVHRLALPGDSLKVTSLKVAVQWITPSGLSVTRPLATLAHIDFSVGKILYLSDLKPESTTFAPYFGSRDDVPSLAKFRAPRTDENLESGPLQLDGRKYRKGLALHSRTKVVYRLPGRFRRFKATVGIDDGVRPHGHVQLVIYGDDKVLLQSAVGGTDPPKSVDLDLTGVRRIAILVDFGDKLDVADHLDLCDARIIK